MSAIRGSNNPTTDAGTASGGAGAAPNRRRGTSRPSRNRPSLHRGEAKYGWLFITPPIIIIGIFLVVPVLLAVWVSVSDWSGLGSPLNPQVSFVGSKNFEAVLSDPGLAQKDFGTSIRNNLYYVVLVVPLQTALALFLAVQVNRRILKGRGFFRTAFYFPSVTSSIAITAIWLFLFGATGAVNKILGFFGASGPVWFADPRGVLHIILGAFGVSAAPDALAGGGMLGVSWWEWLSGPSVAMCAIILLAVFTTSGTFMLLFIAAIQAIGAEVDEAALMDGAGPFRKFFSVTLPMLKPTLFTVLTLGLIGTWQVFDQIYLTGGGKPGKTLLTPAYLAYQTSFKDLNWGQGAAISFILFVIIILLTALQRYVLRDRKDKGKVSRALAGAIAADRVVVAASTVASAADRGSSTSSSSGSATSNQAGDDK
ncbi:multiple sugar transport system permease protein [Cryobacterium sp. MP_M5]|uniref:carbohydrate ABC transporter permease n=1 Tax=unclassified Cryobacterium TaxID=2649013 RepID=UPI0018CB6A6C|nr:MULTISPECIES: sugar ABC transporter permease [unclassified Cryobacterium]MBG6058893.1 multiple sugar transport system permease protein [Cryobacterium sp. MP_M3]MEC5177098.1 multiple sugar transport system permease protein [Cryobacterium sp. MP_M5]